MKSCVSFLSSKTITLNEVTEGMFVIVGVPFERGCAGRKGTALGPDAIRHASLQYSWPEWNGFYDPSLNKRLLVNAQIVDGGNVNCELSDAESREQITNFIQKIIKARGFPVVLGGDHSITEEVLRAYSENIQVVHLDAHGDYQRFDETDAFPSGVVMRKVNSLDCVTRIVQIGMRGFLNSGMGFSDSRKDGNTVISWEDYKKSGIESVYKILDEKIPVYLTFDTDFFNPSICPGTTVPEPDGPIYNEAKNLVCGIANKYKLVGMDITELNPKYDYGGISSLHATKLILDLMASVFENKRS